ncbi:MAG: HD domain-containing phosphohydrolase [candidate division WOR-3 bacterium]
MKILVVDDKKEERYLLETILKNNGFEIVCAENGKRALDILQEEKIDIIISDILMPIMDGYTFLSKCKGDERLKNIPFIFYTATYTSAKDEELGLKLGADLYIRKPIEVDEFLKILKRAISDFIERRTLPRTIITEKTEEVQTLYNQVLIQKLEKKLIDLQKIQWRYNLIIDHIDDFIYWLDENGYFTAVNPQVKMLGYTPEEVVGRHFREFLTPKGLEVAQEHFEKAKAGQSMQDEYTVEFLHKDGSIVLLNIKVYTIKENGKFIGRFGIARDITKIKETEKKLKGSEFKYQLLFKNIPVGVFYYDKNLILTDFNERFVKILNSTYEKLHGLDLNKIKDRRILPSIKSVLEGKEGEYIGYYEATTSAKVIYAEMKCAPVYDENNNIVGGVGLVHDITAQHDAEEKLIESLKKNQQFLEGTVHALASAVEKRDPYTAGHQKRVAQLACAIAKELNLNDDIVQCLNIAGILHDIGKIYVPAEILSKPARLTNAEYDIVKEHPKIGAEILRPIEFPWPVAEIVLQHHERIDGSGYPSGLKLDKILLEARILAVADVVEAMMTHRPYRPAWGVDVALNEIITNKGILYDSNVVEACVRLFKEKGFKF